MSRVLASVVIPAWNGRDWIEACLRSVFAQDIDDLEVIVVDNDSTDGTAEVVEQSFPQALVIRNRRNLGFGGGCNAGFRAAKGKYLVLLNQDAVVEPTWLQTLTRDLENQGVGIVGSKCLFPDRQTIQMAGGQILWPLGVVAIGEQYELDQPDRIEPREVAFVSGCGMAFSRRFLDSVGELDETFWPGYYEDVDFCYRARQAGFQCRYIPEARLYHAEGSAFRSWRSTWRFHHRGRLHFVLKHTAPADIQDRFLPTERLFQPSLLFSVPGSMLARAYLETIRRSLPSLCEAGHFDPEQASAVSDGLMDLARQAVGRERHGSPAGRRTVSESDECLAAALEAGQEHHKMSLRHFRYRLGQLGRSESSAESLQRHVEQLELMLQAREGEVDSLRRVLRSREEELATIRPVLEAREEELATITPLLAAREEELASIRPVLEAREEELAAIKPVLAAREEELASTKTALQVSEKALHELRSSLLGRLQVRLRKMRRSHRD